MIRVDSGSHGEYCCEFVLEIVCDVTFPVEVIVT